MPLPPPAPRSPIHRRRIECHGFRRDDGLWDIEAELTDTKSYAFANHDRGEIAPGEPIHEMHVRVTVDDTLHIVDIEAVTEHGPFDLCPDITPNFARLKGLKLGPGLRKQVNERVGGIHGCTHLRELMNTIATTAFQTIIPIKARERGQAPARGRPLLIGTCHAYAPGSEVVRRIWPEHYQASTSDAES